MENENVEKLRNFNRKKLIKEEGNLNNKLKDYCFIGVDPGNTVALAFLDLKGNLIKIWSKRNPKKEEVVNEIIKTCKPILFVTDVSKIPNFVYSLSSKFLVDIWAPKKDLNLAFKKKLVKENFKGHFDQHMIDALAAVFYYYSRNKRKIDYLINKFGEKVIDILKYDFIKEVKEEKKEGKIEIKENLSKVIENKDIYELKKSLALKERYLKKLKVENKKLKREINKLRINFKSTLNKKIKDIKNNYEQEFRSLKTILNKQEEKIKHFNKILQGIKEGNLIILEPWYNYRYNKLSFIRNEDLKKIDLNEFKKFKKLVKEKNITYFEDFGEVIIAKKDEVEKALAPKEEDIKKIKEFIKIYQEKRRREFY